MNAVDTNVLVYLVDADEPAKQAQARELMDRLAIDESDTVLLWQAAVEFLACLRRWESRGKISPVQLTSYWRQIEAMLPIIPPTTQVIDRALGLCSRHSLSHWDSLLLAACIDAGAKTLYSEDLSDGMTYDSVTVKNPFVPVL
ncbi:MAG: PIN domain-containing protein [Planctomycetota bacterium]